MATPVGKHLLAALCAEGIEALAVQLQQMLALGVAQLLPAHQGVGALFSAGDAVAGEHLAHHALCRIRRATACARAGRWRGGYPFWLGWRWMTCDSSAIIGK